MKSKLLVKLQTLLGVTAGELIVAAALVFGLVAGVVLKQTVYSKGNEYSSEKAELIYQILDSVAEVQKTAYIGSDVAGEPYPELAMADTVVEKEQTYPTSKKKELPSGKININTASKTELMKLPGIGEKTAIAIIEYRTKTKFLKTEDIMNIKGIGIKKYEKMLPFITVK